MWRIFVAAIVVVVSGCSFLDVVKKGGETGEGGAARNKDETAQTTSIHPGRAPVVPALRPRPKPPAPPSLPSLDPTTLIGLDQSGVIAALGEPKDRVDAAPARMWLYAANDCVVKLFFYLDLGDEQFHVLTYETNQQNGGADAAQSCFDQVLRQRTRVD